MKKKPKKNNNKNNKNNKKLLAEKKYEETKKSRIKIENEINEILDELSVEELTELENLGDFSKEAIEWIRTRKKRKKAKQAQEDFEKRIRASDEVIKRSILISRLAGIKTGNYIAKNKKEENLLKAILEEQDMVRGEREKDKERVPDSGRTKSSGARGDRQR